MLLPVSRMICPFSTFTAPSPLNFVGCQLVSVFPSKSGCQAGSAAFAGLRPIGRVQSGCSQDEATRAGGQQSDAGRHACRAQVGSS